MGVPAGRDRTRLAFFFLCCLVAVYFVGFNFTSAPPSAFAQEPAPGEPAPAGEGAAANAPKPEPNMFLHMIKSVGIVMGVILGLLSLSLVFLVVLLVMDLRMGDSVPPAFVEDFTDTVNKRRFKEAFDMARQENSFLGKVLSIGMARLQYGIEDAREAAFNTVESIKASKEQYITYLATIGTLGPLLGLVGTVYSMIGAFMKMSEGMAKPAEMAGTLSHGLVVTLLGIALAVPAIFFHAFFRNRLVKISMEVSNVADDLLTQMYHNSRKPAPAADAQPAAVATAAVKPAK